MKFLKQSATLAMIAMVGSFQVANASDYVPDVDSVYSATLTKMKIDEDLQPRLNIMGQINTGKVTINDNNHTVTLTLNVENHCPPGRYCIAMVQPPIVITLPITERGFDNCGGKVVVATDKNNDFKTGAIPREVPEQTIKVTDHRTNTCPTTNVVPAKTQVDFEYSFIEYGHNGFYKVNTHSEMFGTELVRDISGY